MAQVSHIIFFPFFPASLLKFSSRLVFEKLTELVLSSNSLSKIPDFASDLPLLSTIRLARNKFEFLSRGSGRLERVDLSFNTLKISEVSEFVRTSYKLISLE